MAVFLFICVLGWLRGPCTHSSPTGSSLQLRREKEHFFRGNMEPRATAAVCDTPGRERKTHRKRGRNRRETKYGVAKVSIGFLSQRKHEPIL